MQYTLRNIPDSLDQALRKEAAQEGLSLNEAAIRALARGMGVSPSPRQYRALRDLAGKWQDDPDFDQAIVDQNRIDEELWR